MPTSNRVLWLLGLCLLPSSFEISSCFAQEVVPHEASAPSVDFALDIQTVLARRCYACHGPDQQEGSIRFDQRETLIAEADSGMQALVPGRPEQSELYRRIATTDESERMPPEGKPLSDAELESFKVWIAEGASFKRHWAFQPIDRPSVPQVQDQAWTATPVDSFVLNRIEAASLRPVARAAPRSLIRRVYVDVTGLPPSPEQVEQLMSHWGDSSYAELVDQLLADPAFGERWATNWLDVVRYAETNSYERDGPKPNAWKYRDYVIKAMNDDRPYRQFIREQIAGDELEEVTDDSLTATGYYRLGLWDDEPADPLLARFDGYDDLVSTTSQAILGLTLNCARCHDHKIDPLTQKDYYSMVAFLRDVTPYGTRGDKLSFNQVELDPQVAAQYDTFTQRKKEINRRMRSIEKNAIVKMDAPDQRATEGPERQTVLDEKLKDFCKPKVYEEYTQLKTELRGIEQQERSLPVRRTVLGLAKLDAQPDPTFVLMRGNPHSPGEEEVSPAFPKLLGGGTPDISAAPGARSAGRRRVLADWMTSDDNWMTARVIVNRIWLHYFGRGIVRSPNNFGLMGDPPTHPELIDYLATELIRHDWHLKSVHRLILQSSTYQLSTESEERAAAADPGNDLFWRQNLRRLSAEQVRDGVLAVTGQLNEQRYGPSMFPTLSAEVLASQSRPGNGWGNSSAADQARRSVYIHVKRSLPVPLLRAFDFPDTDISCEARFLTTQPGQALTMLNSDWMQDRAADLLDRVSREVGDDLGKQCQRCLELVLSRVPQPADVEELIDLVDKLKSQHGLSDLAARHAMCLVSLNLNQFHYLD